MKKMNMFTPMKKMLINLPTPMNISIWWNMGSILGICLILQILTGLFLTMHYTANISMAFYSINHICRDVNMGWMMRTLHANGASMFFFFIYIHIGRGLYYQSYKFKETWMVGIMILFMVMAAAFMGYILPWGQMSFWGASVITSLLSAIPYMGVDIMKWIWGGLSVNNATLTRFYSFHFLIPFIIVGLVMIHLTFLHLTGSNNPLSLNSNLNKITFHPYFSYKDFLGFLFMLILLIYITLMMPYNLGDPDNFMPANPMITPIHIQPEWYFLFAYAILRAIPNKLGGVMALMMSIMILAFNPFYNFSLFQGNQFYLFNKILFYCMLIMIILLTWIGMRSVDEPYILLGQLISISYFMYFMINPIIKMKWDTYQN